MTGRPIGKLQGGEDRNLFLCFKEISVSVSSKLSFCLVEQDVAAAREGREENPAIDARAEIPQP